MADTKTDFKHLATSLAARLQAVADKVSLGQGLDPSEIHSINADAKALAAASAV